MSQAVPEILVDASLEVLGWLELADTGDLMKVYNLAAGCDDKVLNLVAMTSIAASLVRTIADANHCAAGNVLDILAEQIGKDPDGER